MNRHSTQSDALETASFFQVTRKYLNLPGTPPVFNLERKIVTQYRKLIPSLLLATGLGAFLAAPSFADGGCGAMGGGRHGEHHAKQKEAHHKMLHDALKLTAEQEAGWKKLIDSEQPRPSAATQSVDWSKLTAPQRAEKMLEFSKVRQEQMGEHVVALKTFYATLTPEQQKTFDDFHSGPRREMRGKSAPAGARAEKMPGESKP